MIDSKRPANWQPSNEEKARVFSFEGYGPDNPDFMFVGLEEYCDGGYDEQRENIWIRCTDPVFAVPRADRIAATNALQHLVKAPVVRTWDVIAAIVAAFTNRPFPRERDAIGTRPPRLSPSTWLTELRPLPRPASGFFNDSYISEWFGFRGKSDYERQAEALSGPRILRSIRQSLAPRYAFFYGLPTARWAKHALREDLSVPLADENDGIYIGRTHQETTIVLTGFYEGQHARSAFRRHQIAHLLARITRSKPAV